MVDLNILADLADLWGGGPPRVLGGRCLNARHRGRACRICVDACPVDALSIPYGPHSSGDTTEAGPIALDRDTCVRCGLCVNVCPTGAFVQSEAPESKLTQTLARSPGAVIELACPRKEPVELTRVPGASVVQTPRCLAALSVPALLELVATGKTLWLNDGICHTCPIGQAQHAIQRAVITANRWLQVLGQSPVIRSYLTTPDELVNEPISRPIVPGEHATITRRDFFRSLSGMAGRATASAVADIPGGSSLPRLGESPVSEEDERGLAHYIPAQRQHQAYALRRLARDLEALVPTASLPIADVSITDACTACGLCARFCPTEALSFVSDDEYYVLNFSAALCLGKDCSLCVIGCPTDAVRFGQEVTLEELLGTRPRPVKAGRLAPCVQCGGLTDVPVEVDETPDTPLCYVCHAQANRTDFLPGLSSREPEPG
jgi:ferredoxin